MKTGVWRKKTDRVQFIVPAWLAAAALTVPQLALARETTLGGGLSAGYEFDDRQYDDDEVPADQGQQESVAPAEDNNRDERYSRLRLAPLVTLTSTAERDELSLSYSPSFWYDLENTDSNVDHDFRAALDRFLTKHWQVKVADNYLRTDEHRSSIDSTDTTAESTGAPASDTADVADETTRLSDSQNRRRYWVNDLSLRSDYEYLQDGVFGLGYRFNVLRNTDSGDGRSYEDYDRHEFSSQLGHRFNAAWKLSAIGSYARGLFDQVGSDTPLAGEPAVERDLHEYGAGMMLEERFIEHHVHTLSYTFYGVDYDAEERNNAKIHDVTLGWQWDFARDLVFGLGAGPSYVDIEDMDGEWNYNANALLLYSFERGQLQLTAGRGYEVLNFTGTAEDNGLREFWRAQLAVNYQLADGLSTKVYAGYRKEDQDVATTELTAATDEALAETETIERKRFTTGANLGYAFWKWYRVILSYDYIRQDSELLNDSFKEHRAALTLSCETDLFKW